MINISIIRIKLKEFFYYYLENKQSGDKFSPYGFESAAFYM